MYYAFTDGPWLTVMWKWYSFSRRWPLDSEDWSFPGGDMSWDSVWCWVFGLNVGALPQYICWIPNAQCDGICRWDLWEVLKLWSRTLRKPLSPCEDTGRGASCVWGEEGFPCWCLGLGLPVSRTVRNTFLLLRSQVCGILVSLPQLADWDVPKVYSDHYFTSLSTKLGIILVFIFCSFASPKTIFYWYFVIIL